VVNDRHEVEGIISTRSILKAFGRDLDETKAKDILLPHTVTITPVSPLEDAIRLMNEKKVEHLVIVSDRPGSKAVLGILDAVDLIGRMANP
jgi:CBS domain-containing protein